MKANNLISQIDRLFGLKTLFSWYTFTATIASTLSLHPLLFNYSPDHWLIPLLGIMSFTLLLTTFSKENEWNGMKLKKYANSNSSTDFIDNTIAPVMVTRFGKSNSANQCQVTTAA